MDDPVLRKLGDRQRETTPDAAPGDDPLFRRFEGDARESLLERVMADLDDVGPAKPEPEPDPASEPTTPAQVSHLPHSGRSVWIGAAVALAAVALAWFVLRPREPAVSLPPYAITQLEGGVAAVRGAPGESPLQLRPTDRIEVTITPERGVRTPVGIALLATPDAGTAVFAQPDAAEVSEDGAVRLRGPLRDFIALDPGAYTFEVLVGAPDRLPLDAAAARADGPWRRVSARVIILAQ